mgnify:CR=1 FL=1
MKELNNAMKCKKHIPVWMYPSRKEVPKEHHTDLLVKRLIGFTDLVICTECGLIGHPIKSHRVGFRWHHWANDDYQTREVEKAKKSVG